MPFSRSSLFAVAALVASSVAIPAIAGDGSGGGVAVKAATPTFAAQRQMSTSQTASVIYDKAPSLYSGLKSTGNQATSTSRFTGRRGLALGVNPEG